MKKVCHLYKEILIPAIIGIPIIKGRWSHDRLILIMYIPYLERRSSYWDMAQILNSQYPPCSSPSRTILGVADEKTSNKTHCANMWRHRSGSALAQVMSCYPTAPAITWSNVDQSAVRTSDNHLRAISKEIPHLPITSFDWKLLT